MRADDETHEARASGRTTVPSEQHDNSPASAFHERNGRFGILLSLGVGNHVDRVALQIRPDSLSGRRTTTTTATIIIITTTQTHLRFETSRREIAVAHKRRRIKAQNSCFKRHSILIVAFGLQFDGKKIRVNRCNVEFKK